MPGPAFTELVGKLIEAMGQTMDAVRPIPVGILLKTEDRFLYAFLENPDQVSLATIQDLFSESGGSPLRLVVFTPGRLPLALTAEIARQGATVVEAQRFHELVRSLGLETYLGEEPRAPRPEDRTRLLPSAQQLDAIMGRARTWMDWGVPALALRFYRQASELKPEFVPARTGIGRALLGLGLTSDAQRLFDEVLAAHPEDVDARLGRAAVLGAEGRPDDEIAVYRTILEVDPRRVEARAQLLAALIDVPAWSDALKELETMLVTSPEDPRLRFLYSVALDKTGKSSEALVERNRARSLGLSTESERSLSEHLGIPIPASVGSTPSEPPVVPLVPQTQPGRVRSGARSEARLTARRVGKASPQRRVRRLRSKAK